MKKDDRGSDMLYYCADTFWTSNNCMQKGGGEIIGLSSSSMSEAVTSVCRGYRHWA